MGADRLTASLERIGQNIQRREETRVYQLPFWPEPVRGTPNAFLRSALFPAIQGKNRKAVLRDVVVASHQGLTVRFTGEQFDQSDLDVWEQAAHLAREHPLGHHCDFTGHGFLKALGRRTGKSDHRWLRTSILRLTAAVVEIKQERFVYGGHLIDEFYRDEETGRYKLVLNKKLLNLFEAGHTYIPWEHRLQLRRKPLALWLSAYYSSHQQPYPVKVATLRQLSGSSTELKAFKRNLQRALNELVNVEALAAWRIDEDDKVHVQRPDRQLSFPT